MKRTLACFLTFLLVTATVILTHSIPSKSQTISGAFRIERNDTDSLLFLLRNAPKLDKIPKYFFGNAYNEVMPNLVVFIDCVPFADKIQDSISNNVRARLIQFGGGKKDLRGEQYIYCLVFAAIDTTKENNFLKKDTTYTPSERKIDHKIEETSDPCKITCTRDTTLTQSVKISPKVKMTQAPLAYSLGSGDFIIYKLVQDVAKKFLQISEEGAEKKASAADSSQGLKMEYIGIDKEKKIKLYYGYIKFPLGENTVNRFGIDDFNGNMIYNTFGNYSSSRFATSFGLLFTWIKKKDFKSTEFLMEADSTRQGIFDPYVFGQIHILRPSKPAKHVNSRAERIFSEMSVDLIVGTRIDKFGEIFDDNFYGFGLGNLYGPLGIVVGGNHMTAIKTDGKKKRVFQFSFGIIVSL